MGAWEQLRLLLYKNFLLRTRQPFILALEVLWPITIFLIVLTVRHIIPPTNKPICHYNARAQPSAGALPFLQSLICNIDNDCINKTTYEEIPTYPQARVDELVDQMYPLMADHQITNLVRALPRGVKLMQAVANTLDQPGIKKILEEGIPIKDFIRNENKMKDILVNEVNISSPNVADALLNSYVKVTKLMQMMGSTKKLADIVCEPSLLKQYLVSENSEALEEASIALCKLDSSSLPNLIDKLQKEIDGKKIMKMISDLMSNFGRPDVGQFMEDMGNMWDTFFSLKSLPFDTTGLNRMSVWFPHVKAIYKSIRDKQVDLSLVTKVAKDLEPLYENKEFGNDIKEMIKYFNTISEWIKKSLNIALEVHSVLGSLFKNTSFAEDKLKDSLNPRALKSLLSIPLSPELKQSFKRLNTPKKLYISICEKPGLVNMIYPNQSSTKDINDMMKFQNVLCSLSLNGTTVEFLDMFNFKQTLPEEVSFSEFINNTASSMTTLYSLFKELSGTSHNYSSIIQKLIDVVLAFIIPSSSDDIKRTIDGIGIIMELIQEFHLKGKTHTAFNIVYNLLNHTLDITNLDRQMSLKYGTVPYWPYMLETFLYTLADEKKIETVLNVKTWPNIFCDENKFSSIFVLKDIELKPVQSFSCEFFTRHFEVISHLKESKNDKPIKWRTLLDKSANLLKYSKDRKQIYHYKWKRLITAYKSFSKNIWKDSDINKRISFIFLTLNGFGQYIEIAKIPYWQDILAIFYSSDQIIQLINNQMKSVLNDNSLQVSHLSLNLPSLKDIVSKVVSILPDVFIAFGNIITNDLKNILDRIEKLPYPLHKLPCEQGSITDIIEFKDKSKILSIEQNACLQGPLITQEVITEPTISSIMIAIQNASRGKEIKFNWTEAGQHVIQVIEHSKQLFNFNGSIFPDVPRFDKVEMKTAIDEVKDMFVNLNDGKKAFKFSSQILDSIILYTENILSDKNQTRMFQQKADCTKGRCSTFKKPIISKSFENYKPKIKKIIKSTESVVKHFADILNRASGLEKIFINDIFNGTIINDILNILKEIPDALQMLIEAIFNPQFSTKISKLVKTNINNFCSDQIIFVETFGTTDETKYIAENFHKKLCQIIEHLHGNISEKLFLGNLIDLSKLKKEWKNPHLNNSEKVQFEGIVDGIITIMDNVKYLTKQNHKILFGLEDTLLSSLKWEDLGGIINEKLQEIGFKKFTLILQHASKALIKADVQNNHILSEKLGIAAIYLEKINGIFIKIKDLTLTNTVNITISDLFLEIPELEEILKWFENYFLPGLEISFHTLYIDNQKIIDLISNFHFNLCNNTVTTFLIPLHNNSDINLLEEGKQKLCDINLIETQKKWKDSISNHTPEIKVNNFLTQLGSILDNIMYLVTFNPQIKVNSPLVNSTKWIKIIDRISKGLNQTISAKKYGKHEVVITIQKILEFGKWNISETVNDVISSMICTLKIFKDGVTWGNVQELYSENEPVLSILNIMNSSIDLVQMLLNTFQEPMKLAAIADKFIYPVERKKNFCLLEKNQWNQYFSSTPNINKIFLYLQNAICNKTYDLGNTKCFSKIKNRKIDETVANNTELAQHIYELFDTLIETFNANIKKLNDSSNQSQSLPHWLDSKVWFTMLNNHFGKLNEKSKVNSIQIWMPMIEKGIAKIPHMKNFLNTLAQIVEIYSNKTKIIVSKNITEFYLHDIFPESPHFQKLLKDWLPLLPEFIETFFWTSFFPKTLSEITKLCEGSLKEHIFNPSFDDQKWEIISDALCTQNYSAISLELKEKFGIEAINNTQPIDWKKFVENLNYSIQLSEKLISKKITVKSKNWNNQTIWINMFKNITINMKNPNVLLYLPFGYGVSYIHLAYSIMCNQLNKSAIQELMCNSTKDKNAWIKANKQLQILLFNANSKDLSWKEFYKIFMNITQMKQILEIVTEKEFDWDLMEKEIFQKIPGTFENIKSEWKYILDIIPPALLHIGSVLEKEKLNVAAFHSIHTIIWIIKEKLVELKNNGSYLLKTEDILPIMPHTQKFIYNIMPVLPDVITTFLWTVQVPDKFTTWIADGRWNLTKIINLLCIEPPTTYLYNPALNSEDWKKLLSPLCDQDFNEISAELLNSFKNNKSLEPISWKKLGLSIIELIKLIEEIATSEKINPPWMSTVHNFTLLLHKPEIKAYIALHRVFSAFCNQNYILNTSVLPSYNNNSRKSELQLFLCEMSTEQFANDVVKSFSKLVSLVRRQNRGEHVSWEEYYNSVMKMIPVKKLLHSILGNYLFDKIERIEENLLNVVKLASTTIWKEPALWKEIIGIFDNIYLMSNITSNKLNEYKNATNLIIQELETLLKASDNNTLIININYLLFEAHRLQDFVKFIVELSSDSIKSLWTLLQQKDILNYKSVGEWEDIFCDKQNLQHKLHLSPWILNKVYREICNLSTIQLWIKLINEFESLELKNKFELILNNDDDEFHYNNLYSKSLALIEIVNYLIETQNALKNTGKAEIINPKQLLQKINKTFESINENNTLTFSELVSIADKMYDVETVINDSLNGRNALSAIYYAHWYIQYFLEKRINLLVEDEIPLEVFLKNSKRFKDLEKQSDSANKLILFQVLNVKIKYHKLKEFLKENFSELFCSKIIKDAFIFPSNSNMSAIYSFLCSKNGILLLSELKEQILANKIINEDTIYKSNKTSFIENLNRFVHEVKELISLMEVLANKQSISNVPLINITRIESTLQKYVMEQNRINSHKFTALILSMIRLIDGFMEHKLMHTIGKNLSPVIVVTIGKFVDSVIKNNIYEAMTNSDVWTRLMKEMFPLIPDIAFIEVRIASEYFNKNHEDLRQLCQLASNKHQWLKSASYDSIMNVYCQQSPQLWEEKLDILSRLHTSTPMYIVDNLHLLLNMNYTIRNQYNNWASTKLYAILEKTILALVDKFASAPLGFYRREQKYWKPVLQAIESLIPSLFNSLNNQVCSRFHISKKESAIARLVDQIITRMPNVETLVCRYPQLNLTTFYQDISRKLDMKVLIEKIYQIKTNKLNNVDCMSVFKPLSNSVSFIQQILIDILPISNLRHLKECTKNSRNGELIYSIQKYAVLFKHVLSLIKEFSNSTKGIFTSPQNMWQSIQDFFTPQMPAFARISEIIIDAEKIKNDLQVNPFNLSLDLVTELMNSSINLNWLSQKNFSSNKIKEALCLKNYNKGIFVIHSDKIDIIKSTLCEKKGIENIFQEIDKVKISTQLPVLQKEYFLSGKWLEHLLTNAQSIFNHLFNLIDTGSRLTSGLAADLFSAFARVINENTVEKLLNSLQGLINSLEPVLQGSPVISDMKIILKGIQGLKSLQGLNLFDMKYRVQDLFSDSDALKKLLKKDLSIENDAIKSIMDANLDLTSLLANENSMSAKDIFCNPKELSQLLNVESTNITIKEISTVLCSISASQAVKVSTILLRELALSRIIGNFAKLGIDDVLHKAGLNWNEAVNAIDTLKSAPLVIPKIKQYISKLTKSLDPEFREHLMQLNVTNDGIRILGTPQALKASGKILCGKPLKTLQDEFKVLEVSHSEPQLDKRELEELPSDFCQHGYEQVMNMVGGPIVWGFFKPILRGKILFSPNNNKTQLIMKELNGTFNSIAKFIDILHAWGEGTSGLQYLQKHEYTLEKMKNLLQSDAVQPLVSQVIGDDASNILKGFNISSLRNQISNVSGLLDLVQLVGNMSQCFELNRFIGFNNELELEKAASDLHERREFIAAIIFLNLNETRSKRDTKNKNPLPPHIKYKLRMDIDNIPSTRKIRDKFWKPGPRDNFLDELRYFRGFIQLQELIDQAIMTIQTNNNVKITASSYMQQFPYPCYEKDEFGHFLKATLPVIMTVAWIFLIAFLVRERVLERELHLEEIMQVMGLRPWVGWLAWFASGLIILTTINLCIVIILNIGGILPYSNWIILLLFLMMFAMTVLMFCYFISVFFNTATIAALTGIIIYLLSFLPFILIITLESEIPQWGKLLSCLMVSTSFCYGCIYITRYEDQGIGLQWQNLWTSPDPKDEMSFGLALIMMFIGSLIYFILGWYISNVWPANLARKQSWYFFLLSKYWNWCRKYKIKKFPSDFPLSLNAAAFIENKLKVTHMEDNISGSTGQIGISLNNLYVIYNKNKSKERVAVAGLSLDLFEGHITTLLGQNGAGKTTTINVLTGQYPPTSGSAFVYGRTLPEEFSEIQKLLGYCPQYNTLFDRMTVREHLKFYAHLKGIFCGKKLEKDINEMLHNMGLWNQQNEQSCYLSGGMRRRLCVALAFIGGSKLIILDEPTSSVDPVARRNIWDLIMKYRYGRTILLTTHHMDEADILSDRVAIIHRGKLLCSGSPLLLKSKFGCGYQLTLSRQNTDVDRDSDSGRASSACSEGEAVGFDTDGLLNFVQNIIPTATLMEDHGSEVVLSLPQRSHDGTAYNFYNFFTSLDSNLNQLGFSSYGLSSTTLEEVFLTLCHLEDTKLQLSSPTTISNPVPLPKPILSRSISDTEKYSQYPNKISTDLTDLSISNDPWSTQNLNLGGSYQLTGTRLKLQQLRALLMKRYYHTVHDWKAIVSSIFLPCIFIAIAMGFALIKPLATPEPMLLLTPSMFGPGDVMFVGKHDLNHFQQELNILDSLLAFPGIGTSCMTDSSERFNNYCNKLTNITAEKFIPTAIELEKSACKCENSCSKSNFETPMPYIVTSTGDIIFNLTNMNINDYLLNTYMAFTEKRYGGWTFSNVKNKTEIKIWYENTGYHSAPSYLNSISNAILRANMKSKGINPQKYGITVYNHPIHLTSEQLGRDTIVHRAAEIGIALVFLLGFAFVPSSFIVYVVRERTQEEKRLQYVGGVGPVLYWSSALLWDMLLVIITVSLSAAIIISFALPVYVSRFNLPAVILLLLLFGWATTPLMYLLEKLFQEASIAFMVLYCINIFIGLNIMVALLVLSLFSKSNEITQLVGILKYFAMIFPQYAVVGGLFELARNHLQADIFSMFGQDTYKNPFNMNLLGQYYLAMALEGIIFFLINLLLEFSWKKNLTKELKHSSRSSSFIEDSDVLEERKRVQSEISKHDVLKLVNVTQMFRSMAGQNCAVDNLSLSIPKGECFGLLGVNGAGKTTLFRILTGQLRPSLGNVYVKNMSVSKVLSTSSQLLGYCPQADALDDLLTPEQHLSVYAKLRGIPNHEIKEVIYRALSKFHLKMYADRKVGTLSRGTKRKVCTAISMLGNPQIILLDEPTTGMDPVTRRLVWSNVQQAIKDQRSVVLTSHSMEECDILCSRLAIMVNGRLQCLGSPQYLKYKFGTGYTISIRVADGITDWGMIVSFIHSNFPSAVLRAHHCNMVEFSLPSKNTPLSTIFGNLEKHSSQLGILDVSVSQTTLDQVFVSFARQQTDEILPDDVPLEIETVDRMLPSAYNNIVYDKLKEFNCSMEINAFTNKGFVEDELKLPSFNSSCRNSSIFSMYEDDEDCQTTKF